ncbi:forkhead box Q2 [Nothobranchius furzeri]|uniref:Forkhead box Q2 n=1 Tax=Nothobranchius furzeri TaxID=105023 RepID=A0A8C6P8E5_NOTFU|nr:forkhead box protein D5-A-like [Nothobranchius furzeri]
MTQKYLSSKMTMESRSSSNGNRDRLGLSFTIDYLLFNGEVKDSTAEETENNTQLHRNPEPGEVKIPSETARKSPKMSEAGTEKGKTTKEEWDEEQSEEGEEEVTTTTTSTSCNSDKSQDKPNQSYIALISKAILASVEKKLLLCDIYQWIMDHYPYFKSKDKNWRNSVRHNLSLNDCFIKAGRSDNGKGHFWAIHPANYQDFSKGDYHCRRARRRARRVVGQLRLSSLTFPYHPTATFTRPQRASCWCCPQASTLPLSCLAPRLYWPWSSMQPPAGLHLGLNPSAP